MNEPTGLYGVVAEFDDPGPLVDAAKAARAAQLLGPGTLWSASSLHRELAVVWRASGAVIAIAAIGRNSKRVTRIRFIQPA